MGIEHNVMDLTDNSNVEVAEDVPFISIKDAKLYKTALESLIEPNHLVDELVYTYMRHLFENLVIETTDIKLINQDFYNGLKNKRNDIDSMIRLFQKRKLENAAMVIFPVCTS